MSRKGKRQTGATSPKRRRRKCWSYSAGEYPNTVIVHERTPGGMLYARAWDPTLKRQVRTSLRHRNQEAAREYAEAEARKLREGLAALPPAAMVGSVLKLYLLHRTPQKKTHEQRKEDERRAQMWIRVLGGETRIAALGAAEWTAFIRDRITGAINARGVPVPSDQREVVAPRTVDADLVFINSVFNWALGWKVQGRAVLSANPWAAPAPGVKRTLERPKERSPRRPITTYDRYLKLAAVAPRVLMEAKKGDPDAQLVTTGTKRHGKLRRVGPKSRYMKPSYLPELLDLAEDTGRRISSICRLEYDDPIHEGGQIVKIMWPPLKGEEEKAIAVSDRTREILERILRKRPGVGKHPIFPAPRDPSNPISRHLADDWLREAEALAELEHLERGAWHPFRRKWGTERKHLPTKDVMEAGGWKDERSLKTSYQQADEETTLAVLNEPRKLMERKA